MSWFPGYAIDLDRGMRLNMIFSESSLLDTARGNDLQWEPRATLGAGLGFKNYIYVLNTRYDQGAKTEFQLDSIYTNFSSQAIPNFMPRVRRWYLQNVMYTGLLARAINFASASEQPLLLSPIRVKLRVQRAFNSYAHFDNNAANQAGDCNPVYAFEIGQGTGRNVATVGQSAMDQIRIVPNPYLSISGYENSQIDNRVKIVNIPSQCVVSIFNLAGSLVRQFNFDQTSTRPYAANAGGELVVNNRGTNYQTFLEWDLKNQLGLPIASGVYIVHVRSEKYGDKIIKWFGVLRPIDLDTFQ
jgi:hypothetical protein